MQLPMKHVWKQSLHLRGHSLARMAVLLAIGCLSACQSTAPARVSGPGAEPVRATTNPPAAPPVDVATVPPSVPYVKPASVIKVEAPANAAELEDAAAKKSRLAGQKAPDFKLLDQSAKEVTLADFKGKWVVLYFYPVDDTPGCTCNATEFTESLHQFRSMNAEIVGVSPDTPSMHAYFVAKYNLALRILSDLDYAVAKQYGSYFDASQSNTTSQPIAPSGKSSTPVTAPAPAKQDAGTSVVNPFGGAEELKPSVGVKSPIIRSTYIIDPKGVIVWHCPAIIPQGHAGRVRDRLKALQARG